MKHGEIGVPAAGWSEEQIRGGIYGLLIGDAVGVPYEFHAPEELPDIEEIDMVPPVYFSRSHRGVPVGTWSDDGAQMLCLLESLVVCGEMNLHDFAQRLWEWWQQGRWAIDGKVFDVGMQTSASLRAYASGVAPEKAGLAHPQGQGNGALMRVLPIPLWHQGTDEELIGDAAKQCLITHGHLVNQIACSLFSLWVRAVAWGASMEEGYQRAVQRLRELYPAGSQERKALEETFRPDEEGTTQGGGYVVETLHSVRFAVRESSFEAVIKKAISLGNDTDTNAAIAGALYGVKVGWSGLPQRWLELLRGKKSVDDLLSKWFSQLCDEAGRLNGERDKDGE